MADRSRVMELGNLICKFGEDKVLMDLVDEIVLPSFEDKSLERTYSTTKYFFHGVKPLVIPGDDEPIVCVVGRFIKDTRLERDQYFKDNQLISDEGSLESAPSSIFVLILNTHKLIFVKETRFAPDMNTFRATLHDFLKKKRLEHINALKEAGTKDENGKKMTKAMLGKLIPKVSLELIPLTSADDITTFIKKFDTLKSLQITFAARNDEADVDPFFETVRKRKDILGSTKTTITHRNTEGLDKDKVIDEVQEATAHGTQVVKLSGEDVEGDKLSGNNEKFQLKKDIDQLSPQMDRAAKQLYSTYQTLIGDGLVQPAVRVGDNIKERIIELARRLS